jgi:chitinase
MRARHDEAGNADKRKYLLTIAAPAGPGTITNLEIDKIHRHLDWINLMAYDFHGGWDATTHFNAPLFAIKNDPARDALSKKLNVDAAVQTYLAAGVPPEKLVVGVSFCGRGWAGVGKENDGLYQAKKSIPKGTWEEGIFDYKDLAKNYVGKFQRHWHDEAKVPWLYEEMSGVMISYDDPESLKLKAQYIRDKKLGGVMCWELSADDVKSTLLNALK